MIPDFDSRGLLPVGIHIASWEELQNRFGVTARRRRLLMGLRQALDLLAGAGCQRVYIDGSFVTNKYRPSDIDVCWDVTGVDPDALDPVFFEFSDDRAAQKARFGSEFFPAQIPEGVSGKIFLQFFQTDTDTGEGKGIVELLLDG